MNKILRFLCAASAIVINSGFAWGSVENPTATIGTYFIPGYVESKTEGKYIQQYRAIFKQLGLTLNLDLQPTRRIQHNFKNGNLIGYFPELIENMPQNACRTAAIDQKLVHIFTRQGSPLISRFEQLDSLRLAAVAGYSYGEFIKHQKHLDISYLQSDISSIKMLAAGRVDGVIGDHVTTMAVIKQLGLSDKIDYDSNFIVADMDVFWVFQNTVEGLELCDRVSEAIITIDSEEPKSYFYDGLR